MEAYIKGPWPWFWFIGEEGLTSEDWGKLYTSDVEAYGIALTRWGARRRARRTLARIEGDPPLEQVSR